MKQNEIFSETISALDAAIKTLESIKRKMMVNALLEVFQGKDVTDQIKILQDLDL